MSDVLTPLERETIEGARLYCEAANQSYIGKVMLAIIDRLAPAPSQWGKYPCAWCGEKHASAACPTRLKPKEPTT